MSLRERERKRDDKIEKRLVKRDTIKKKIGMR